MPSLLRYHICVTINEREASGGTGNKTRESLRTLPGIDYKQFNEVGDR